MPITKSYSLNVGLPMNKKKSEDMIVDRNSMIRKEIGGFEVVGKIFYLGYDKEIKRRLPISRNPTITLTRIWKDIAISQNNKFKLLNILIFRMATYASET